MTAQLNRSAGRLVFTLSDGSQRTLALAPRAQAQWQADCYTMGGHTLNAVGDLSPAPLNLESLTFTTPLVVAKCAASRMILAEAAVLAGEAAGHWLAFDLQ
jgi:hypothetical protein